MSMPFEASAYQITRLPVPLERLAVAKLKPELQVLHALMLEEQAKLDTWADRNLRGALEQLIELSRKHPVRRAKIYQELEKFFAEKEEEILKLFVDVPEEQE